MRRWQSVCCTWITAWSLGCATTEAAVDVRPVASEEKLAAPPQPVQPLYARLGGQPALEAVTDDFLKRVSTDERINAGFAGSDVPRVRRRLIDFLCQASGGPCVYSGRSMKKVHAGMGVSADQFAILVAHLVATLDNFKVPSPEKAELLSLLSPLQPDIVEE